MLILLYFFNLQILVPYMLVLVCITSELDISEIQVKEALR